MRHAGGSPSASSLDQSTAVVATASATSPVNNAVYCRRTFSRMSIAFSRLFVN
jgi:hypothetical protein